MTRKRTSCPKGEMYNIYVSPSIHEYRKRETRVWEGHGEEDPWKLFDELAKKHLKECVTIYVVRVNVLHELAQYWNGKVEYALSE